MTAFGCQGHGFKRRFRDLRARRATALVQRLGRMGACCCECEVFWNAHEPCPRYFGRGLLLDTWLEPVGLIPPR